MNGKTRKFIEQAMAKARESHQQFRHGSILTMGGKVVAQSCNSSNRTVLAGRSMTSIHAEMMALSQAFRNKPLNHKRQRVKNRNRKLDLYVVRLGDNDCLSCSKPCGTCVKALQRAGVKRVIYSMAGGGVCMEKVCDIRNSHVSFHQDAHRMREYPVQKIRF